ncbi:SLAM family member 9-like isoform X2 [Colossoma macropomum]|uniref:SLAM family member 9-like isoform X2 n=1 Tax=Colossoma macropomum TaxID=42526 RepID=UPI0018650360|nr:SLAM family member 9-like isoform X2 [Colossoma macropomum]
MAMMLQLIFVLSTLISITVSCDEFRLVGGSVQLDTQDPVPDFDDLFWEFNKINNVLKYEKKSKNIIYFSDYKGRVEFNEETYSLTLKNLQKTDSGPYEAQASGDNVTVVAEYRLSVLDPVEAPVLTHQLSRDTCSITLTCRGHDLSISSSYFNKTCEEKEVTSPEGVALSLSVNGSSIICNHSNPASWKIDVLELKELEQLCGLTVRVVVGVVVFILIFAFIVICLYLRKNRGPTQQENTDAQAGNQLSSGDNGENETTT